MSGFLRWVSGKPGSGSKAGSPQQQEVVEVRVDAKSKQPGAGARPATAPATRPAKAVLSKTGSSFFAVSSFQARVAGLEAHLSDEMRCDMVAVALEQLRRGEGRELSGLVSLMASDDSSLRAWAARAFFNTVSHNEETEKLATTALTDGSTPGCVLALLPLIGGSAAEKEWASKALGKMAKLAVPVITDHEMQRILQALVLLLADKQPRVRAAAARALSKLASCEHTTVRATDGVIAPLTTLLVGGSDDERSSAVAALCNFAHRSKDNCEALAAEESTLLTLAKLLDVDSDLRNWAARTFSFITNHGLDLKKRVGDVPGVIPSLVGMLSAESADEREVASSVLCNLGNEPSLRNTIGSHPGAAKALASLLTSESPAGMLAAELTIYNLLTDSAENVARFGKTTGLIAGLAALVECPSSKHRLWAMRSLYLLTTEANNAARIGRGKALVGLLVRHLRAHTAEERVASCLLLCRSIAVESADARTTLLLCRCVAAGAADVRLKDREARRHAAGRSGEGGQSARGSRDKHSGVKSTPSDHSRETLSPSSPQKPPTASGPAQPRLARSLSSYKGVGDSVNALLRGRRSPERAAACRLLYAVAAECTGDVSHLGGGDHTVQGVVGCLADRHPAVRGWALRCLSHLSTDPGAAVLALPAVPRLLDLLRPTPPQPPKLTSSAASSAAALQQSCSLAVTVLRNLCGLDVTGSVAAQVTEALVAGTVASQWVTPVSALLRPSENDSSSCYNTPRSFLSLNSDDDITAASRTPPYLTCTEVDDDLYEDDDDFEPDMM